MILPLLMTDVPWWSAITRPEVFPIAAGCAVGAIAIIATVWAGVQTHRADVELKRDMIARGMSVEEIERVLAAKSSKPCRKGQDR